MSSWFDKSSSPTVHFRMQCVINVVGQAMCGWSVRARHHLGLMWSRLARRLINLACFRWRQLQIIPLWYLSVWMGEQSTLQWILGHQSVSWVSRPGVVWVVRCWPQYTLTIYTPHSNHEYIYIFIFNAQHHNAIVVRVHGMEGEHTHWLQSIYKTRVGVKATQCSLVTYEI